MTVSFRLKLIWPKLRIASDRESSGAWIPVAEFKWLIIKTRSQSAGWNKIIQIRYLTCKRNITKLINLIWHINIRINIKIILILLNWFYIHKIYFKGVFPNLKFLKFRISWFFMIFLDIQLDIKILKTVCGQILRFENVIPSILSKWMKNTENSLFSTKKCDFSLIFSWFDEVQIS